MYIFVLHLTQCVAQSHVPKAHAVKAETFPNPMLLTRVKHSCQTSQQNNPGPRGISVIFFQSITQKAAATAAANLPFLVSQFYPQRTLSRRKNRSKWNPLLNFSLNVDGGEACSSSGLLVRSWLWRGVNLEAHQAAEQACSEEHQGWVCFRPLLLAFFKIYVWIIFMWFIVIQSRVLMGML